MERAREVLPASVKYADSAYAAAQNADALLILTDWEEFAALDLERLRHGMKYPIIIDGRNLYDPQLMESRALTYISMGRPDVYASQPAAMKREQKLRVARRANLSTELGRAS
jgi:UDPglucose 6-dehydrogenase